MCMLGGGETERQGGGRGAEKNVASSQRIQIIAIVRNTTWPYLP